MALTRMLDCPSSAANERVRPVSRQPLATQLHFKRRPELPTQHPSLRSRVSRRAPPTLHAQQRRHIDDTPRIARLPPLPHHNLSHNLTPPHRPHQIRLNNLLKQLRLRRHQQRRMSHPGCVHENIDVGLHHPQLQHRNHSQNNSPPPPPPRTREEHAPTPSPTPPRTPYPPRLPPCKHARPKERHPAPR